MNRVLVTGADGFIGRHLVRRLLESGCSVRALVRRPPERPAWPGDVKTVAADIRDRERMDSCGEDCDTVFHLAACSTTVSGLLRDENEYGSVNVEGTRNVLDAAAKAGVTSFVFFSSVKAAGEETRGCEDESCIPRPQTPYGRSKLMAERLVMEYGGEHDLHAVSLRLPMVYGPGSRGNLMTMIAAVDRGLFPPMPRMDHRRSMVHVGNVVDAALLAATRPAARGRCYIVTDARPYTTREIYEAVCRGLGKRVPRWQMPVGLLKALAGVGDAWGRVLPGRVPFDSHTLQKLLGPAWYSGGKIQRELGFVPSMSFEEALPELIRWYRENRRDARGRALG